MIWFGGIFIIFPKETPPISSQFPLSAVLILACVDLPAVDTSNIRLMPYVAFCMAAGAHSVTHIPIQPCSANRPSTANPRQSSLFPAPETWTLGTQHVFLREPQTAGYSLSHWFVWYIFKERSLCLGECSGDTLVGKTGKAQNKMRTPASVALVCLWVYMSVCDDQHHK